LVYSAGVAAAPFWTRVNVSEYVPEVNVTTPVLASVEVFSWNERITSCMPFSPDAGDTVSHALLLVAVHAAVAAIVTARLPASALSPFG
jgi:hypothetical protein